MFVVFLFSAVPRFFIFFFFFYCSGAHRDLHSFPTRRSSDLFKAGNKPSVGAANVTWDEFLSPAGEPFVSAQLYAPADRKSTRLNSSHRCISYAVFCLKKKKKKKKKSQIK